MTTQTAERYVPTGFSHSFTIDRARLTMDHREISEDLRYESPIGQYLMNEVRDRHERSPDVVRRYAETLAGPDEDENGMPDPPGERMLNLALSLDEDRRRAESAWMEDIVALITELSGPQELWHYTRETERVSELADMKNPANPHALDIPLPMTARETEMMTCFADMGIKAEFSGEYRHDAPCETDGFCCLKFAPKTNLPPGECMPHRKHHYAATVGVLYDSADQSVGIPQTCLRCGAARTLWTKDDRYIIDRRSNVRRQVRIGVSIGDDLLVTGAPGIRADWEDPAAVFGALANGVMDNLRIKTLDGRDVTARRCAACDLWVGDTMDPDIAHVSTDHSQCSPPAKPK